MSRDGRVSLVWAGDEREFRLGIDECLALEERRNTGLGEVLYRLSTNAWRIEDIRETLRLGLIGAGVEGKKARELVEAQVSPGKLAMHVLTAQAVLLAAIAGDANDAGDDEGKAEAATDVTELNGFPPPPSTEPEQSSDTPPKKSDE
ncbi:gene transfer agent family protein [Rhodoligotrophos ferricapiens]|uniref:gene transfer agent family protein n=1 Tax=Rhodoligotrophos ferricapiens TaxID=3069264 RepID=UPI00315D1BAE